MQSDWRTLMAKMTVRAPMPPPHGSSKAGRLRNSPGIPCRCKGPEPPHPTPPAAGASSRPRRLSMRRSGMVTSRVRRRRSSSACSSEWSRRAVASSLTPAFRAGWYFLPPAMAVGAFRYPVRPASKRNQIRCSASSIRFSSKLALARSPCSSHRECAARMRSAIWVLSSRSSASMSDGVT